MTSGMYVPFLFEYQFSVATFPVYFNLKFIDSFLIANASHNSDDGIKKTFVSLKNVILGN